LFDEILTTIIEGRFKSDREFQAYLPDAIYIKDIFNVDLDSVQPHDQLKSKKRDGSKQSIKYSYISTPLDLSKDTFEEAIKNNNYTKDECWINTLYDFYKDTLLSTNKKRIVISREIILNVLNRTEENIKEGLSVEDILPFFIKYKLRLRVFDMFCKLIFKYDPPSFNNNNKVLHCMTKGDHIYTLNYNIKSLEQKQNEEDDASEYIVKASPDYKVSKDDEETNYYKMINTVDDILKIIKEMEN
jgi:hypothetical protein